MSNNRKLPIDTQFDYDKMIDMKAEQLDALVKECEINLDRIRGEIVKNYQQAQPFLMQMRMLKQQLKRTSEKMEAAKTFLSMEKNGSLVSNIDLVEIKHTVQEVETSLSQPEPQTPPAEEGRQIAHRPVSLESHSKLPAGSKFKSPLVTNWVNKNKQQAGSANLQKPKVKPATSRQSKINLKKLS